MKTSILTRTYVNHLISSLYIEAAKDKKGYAKEMINDLKLTGLCWQSTTSVIPFFKKDDIVVRGNITHYTNGLIHHSWINFYFNNKQYVFDPSLNILVEKELYDEVFLVEELANVKAVDVKNAILDTLEHGQKSAFDDRRLVTATSDINAPFYRCNMHIKGETIGKKILTLNTRFEGNN